MRNWQNRADLFNEINQPWLVETQFGADLKPIRTQFSAASFDKAPGAAL
jgi:hypothetical protein